MDVRCELTSAVRVTEEIPYYGEYDAGDLQRDVPAGADNLNQKNRFSSRRGCRSWRSGWKTYTKNHAGWEDKAEGDYLDDNVNP